MTGLPPQSTWPPDGRQGSLSARPPSGPWGTLWGRAALSFNQLGHWYDLRLSQPKASRTVFPSAAS
ncbi:hypothetical protein BN381_20024 [Candidatus Microthrix parvicella RN1]|uniref:Uncharacterized protein n=1 Tax=Candidatus Neomicrothrix parvicella RN1 TaxID=1229780 RepID=R4YY16_9ACTN|nr:hypothetical protein BN381_20024 [Candidatus Microthrix parvicella RN1]